MRRRGWKRPSEENKAAIRDEISSLEDDLNYWEQNRYSITAERIQYYQQTMLPMLYVERQNVLYSGQPDGHDRDQYPHQSVHRGRDPPGIG